MKGCLRGPGMSLRLLGRWDFRLVVAMLIMPLVVILVDAEKREERERGKDSHLCEFCKCTCSIPSVIMILLIIESK